MRLLAIAESDAYLKWAAWTVERLPDGWDAELVIVGSTTSPSGPQTVSAVSGTRWAADRIDRLPLSRVRGRVRRTRPDLVLVACSGPILAAVTASLATLRRRPIVACGIPGLALPVRRRAVDARRGIDVFVAHSRRERREFEHAFSQAGGGVRVALSTLPFLAGLRSSAPGGTRIVFAAQPSVPASLADRQALVRMLAALGPPAALVKLRTLQGEGRQTHHEPHPLDAVWDELVAGEGLAADRVEFLDGPMERALDHAASLATVSSTAVLEAIARGLPVVVVDDFGVSPELLNDIFDGSGVIGSLTRYEPRRPRREWCDDNYFHDARENDLVEVLTGAVAGPRSPRRRLLHRRFAIAAGRGFARAARSRWSGG